MEQINLQYVKVICQNYSTGSLGEFFYERTIKHSLPNKVDYVVSDLCVENNISLCSNAIKKVNKKKHIVHITGVDFDKCFERENEIGIYKYPSNISHFPTQILLLTLMKLIHCYAN